LIEAGKGTPAVLILPGSGPTDRDGNNALGVKGGAYRQLAEGLQAKHISSLRIDKRGIGGSARAMANPNAVTIDDYVSDTAKWVDLLKTHGHRCVWLAGHSEGGLIALAAAQRVDICGLILIAAPGRKLDAILHDQLAASLPADMLAATDKAIASLASGSRVDPSTLPAPVQPLFAPATQGYLIDMMRYDPAAMAAAIQVPMLIVQGSEDVQVKLADAAALSKAQPKATMVPIEGMNHVFKRVPKDDRAANLKSYGVEGPIAPGLIDTIAAFIGARR
jgi:pimeloyl-ACP methyl ester carboxylesterase